MATQKEVEAARSILRRTMGRTNRGIAIPNNRSWRSVHKLRALDNTCGDCVRASIHIQNHHKSKSVGLGCETDNDPVDLSIETELGGTFTCAEFESRPENAS